MTNSTLQDKLPIIEMCVDMPNELDNVVKVDDKINPKHARNNDKIIITSSLVISFNDVIIKLFVIIELE